MANLTLIWHNKSDTATLSGGSWVAALPLENMQQRLLKQVARSTDATLTNTQFIVDLGGTTAYQAFCILSHNLSTTAKVRVQSSVDAGFATTVFDSDWRDAYEYSTPMSQRLWEDANWWDGKPTDFDLNGYSLNTVIVSGILLTARYIKIEIDDVSNTAGYIEIGRLIVAPMTELAANINWGSTLAWEDNSLVDQSIGGSAFFEQRAKQRIFSCDGSFMTDAEALGGIFEMQKNQGITGEIFVMPDRDDIEHSFRRSFLASMTALSGINKWVYALNKTTYKFKELL